MNDEVLVRVDGVAKKFCRTLRRSLWYGVQDTVGDLLGRGGADQPLRRDEFWAVDDVSFELKRGECLGLVGHNGAGKTTLLKMLNGLIKPDRGRIEMRGRVGALIALGAGFNPVLTGRENIYVNGAVLGLSKREIDAKYDEIVAFADIGEFIHSPVQSYSSGMQVRLGFAIAVAVRPDILLLDEVLAVGDVNFQAKCFNTLAKFRESGTSFILVSHNLHMISRYCQQVLYLRGGRTAHLGEVERGLALLSRDMSDHGVRGDEEAPDWEAARGSGRIRFTGAEFLDGQGARVFRAQLGEPLTLSLHYERSDPTLRDVRLDVVMREGDRIVFQADNLSAGQPLAIARSAGTISVTFAYIASNVDRLRVSFSMLDPETGEVHDWKRNLALEVERRSLSQGGLFTPTAWVVEDELASAQRHPVEAAG